jgi:proteic killer suppression protein
LDPKHIKHKGLKRLAETGDARGINPSWLPRVKQVLFALDVAVSVEELRLPHFRLHQLKGDRQGTYSIWVTKNQRITFKWRAFGPYDVDLEDYHG